MALTKLQKIWTSSNALTLVGLGAAIVLILSVITLTVAPFATSFMTQWSRADVETRSKLIYVLTRDDMTTLLSQGRATVQPLFERIAADEKVLAVGYCDRAGQLLYPTQLMPASFTCEKVSRSDASSFSFVHMAGRKLLIGAFPLKTAGGHFVILNDVGFVEQRGAKVTRYFLAIFIAIVLIALIAAVVLAILTVRRWVGGVRHALLTARSGQSGRALSGPFEHEVRQLLRRMDAKRSCIEDDRAQWDASALRRLMSNELSGMDVIVVSNREPYIHNRGEHGAEIQLPGKRPGRRAGARDPRLRRNLDCARQRLGRRGLVDANDRIAVPPDAPSLYAAPRLAHGRGTGSTIITDSPTRDFGRSAISPSSGRSSARPTGSSTGRSTSASPMRSCARPRRRRPGRAGAGLPFRAAAAR